MQDLRDKCRVLSLVSSVVLVGIVGIYGLLKPISNGCIMTYMYPTYIPISPPEGVPLGKYGLYLYHEGWKKIDFKEHLKKLNGVPVLYIPGNGGSYKQVRSLAAESDRAFQGGPLERAYYQDAILTSGGGNVMDGAVLRMPSQYSSRLDWFAVDLEGEHSAMDGRILEEHAEYVVHSVHRILDQYKESRDALVRDGATSSRILPKTVILVGHSMGGFVARAAVVHPHLRKSAVETILTLSTPHQSPPLALQPSFGHYFSCVNREWRKGYEAKLSPAGYLISEPALSRVVVVSITGGFNDYQVRSQIESLEGIVPPSHGFMISSTSMKNVWLSMEHQAILWCNQLVVQVSHTILSLLDPATRQPFPESHRRLAIFTRMLKSGLEQSFHLQKPTQSPMTPGQFPTKDETGTLGSQLQNLPSCPINAQWRNDGLEKDLYIETRTVTVLAMDGRRRWLDIQKLGAEGRNHFILVTNLAPCYGVRLHLWPEKGKSESDFPPGRKVQEVTAKMAHIPSGPAPRQIEPGSQTEQAPPSGVFLLGPEDMLGFRFITISVAPRPSVSGRPPPPASMAVGQFFNPNEGHREFSPATMFLSYYSQKDLLLEEDHPLLYNMSFGISLGLLPIEMTLRTVGCGIKDAGLPIEEAGDTENSGLCKLRCFPPVALVWDAGIGPHVIPNVYSESIIVDSSPALWSSTQSSERTTLLLLVDPHCSYKTSIDVSFTMATSRFLLLYNPKIIAFSFAVIFFALMHQSHALELDVPIPSLLTALQSNLRMPLPAFLLTVVPIAISLLISLLMDGSIPSPGFIIVSIICYFIANGVVIILMSSSQVLFYLTAFLLVFINTRWRHWQGSHCLAVFHRIIYVSSGLLSVKVVRFVWANPSLTMALVGCALACLVHPALGLFVLVGSHAFCCHSALFSSLGASFRRQTWRSQYEEYSRQPSHAYGPESDGKNTENLPMEYNSSSPDSARSFANTQLDLFRHCHGLLMLHLLAALMFVPSLAASWQRIGRGQIFPRFLDSMLCVGVILHGICSSKPESRLFTSALSSIFGHELRMHHTYLLAGYYTFLSGLALAPYRVFYAMAALGGLCFLFTVLRCREKADAYTTRRKHSHRH
ncbi:hypothetical protein MLD38_000126 [Melastoma candidum]|uniref:Uncharacterized protein n=1 Tax=Melastoma candidum TaxID=119954 RepID=A0ACB9S9H7_9MYRT|nr:hypothetical protein MLD38_000126 [Melastoma candidum]